MCVWYMGIIFLTTIWICSSSLGLIIIWTKFPLDQLKKKKKKKKKKEGSLSSYLGVSKCLPQYWSDTVQWTPYIDVFQILGSRVL